MVARKPVRQEEKWIQKYWRPVIAFQYVLICLFDFMLAPIGLSVYAALRDVAYIAWVPLTLQGGGMYHISMGAILGVSAWRRSIEKVENGKPE